MVLEKLVCCWTTRLFACGLPKEGNEIWTCFCTLEILILIPQFVLVWKIKLVVNAEKIDIIAYELKIASTRYLSFSIQSHKTRNINDIVFNVKVYAI